MQGNRVRILASRHGSPRNERQRTLLAIFAHCADCVVVASAARLRPPSPCETRGAKLISGIAGAFFEGLLGVANDTASDTS